MQAWEPLYRINGTQPQDEKYLAAGKPEPAYRITST